MQSWGSNLPHMVLSPAFPPSYPVNEHLSTEVAPEPKEEIGTPPRLTIASELEGLGWRLDFQSDLLI